jgi:hypothetical protein
MAQRLKLIPSTAQYACGVDYELSSRNNARDKFTEVVKVQIQMLEKLYVIIKYGRQSMALVYVHLHDVNRVVESCQQGPTT